MILVYLLAAVAALVVYAVTARLGIVARVVIALLVFTIPSVAATVWVYMIGDKAPPDAVTVQPKNEKPSSSDTKSQ